MADVFAALDAARDQLLAAKANGDPTEITELSQRVAELRSEARTQSESVGTRAGMVKVEE